MAVNPGGNSGNTPAGGTAAAQGAGHTVVKGDTLWGLSQRYGVALSQLIAPNPQISNPNLIYAGQKVRIK